MTRQNIITVDITNGTASGTEVVTLDSGIVERIVAISSAPNDNHNNPSMVRVELTSNGKEVVPLQPLDFLRSRNVPANEDGFIIDDIGGKTVKARVVSDDNFTADTQVDLVVIYKNKENC